MLWVGCSGSWAQTAVGHLQFSLDRDGPPAQQYTLTISQSGEGQYVPHLSAGPASEVKLPADGDSRALRVSPAAMKKLFAAVPMVEGGRCETHSKNIAKSGTKTLRYSGAGREAQCTYNYSDDDRVNEATAVFEGIAETLRFGDRLRAKLRFDRLGLDSELEGLQTAVTEQRALEVGNIAPVLKTIAEDERVMDRARRKAELLLQGVAPAQTVVDSGSSAL